MAGAKASRSIGSWSSKSYRGHSKGVHCLCNSCQDIGYLGASGDRPMQLMSVSAAARHLGYKSRSQLYKLMNDGWMDEHVRVQIPSGQYC